MTPRLIGSDVAGTGVEVVLAEWPDGMTVTRWAGNGWDEREIPCVRLLNGPELVASGNPSLADRPGEFNSYVTVGGNGHLALFMQKNRIPRWLWFVRATMAEGALRENYLNALRKARREQVRLEKKGASADEKRGADLRLESVTEDPGTALDGFSIYQLLGEDHPAFLSESIFREWLAGEIG